MLSCRHTALLALVAAAACAPHLTPVGGALILSAADSSLVGRILLAEDRRDSLDAALAQGRMHADIRVRTLAERALGRIRDPRYAARDTTSRAVAPPAWPEPAWRLRYRALSARSDCATIRAATADSAWPVRLRAVDVAPAACGTDDAMVRQLDAWVRTTPTGIASRVAGGVSWHAGAHALVALARLRPADARALVPAFATHPEWHVRVYAARAAAVLADSATLRRLARDPSPNVAEAAVESLSRLSQGEVSVFLPLLDAPAPQVVRAAAVALKGAPNPDVVRAAHAAFERWVAHGVAPERDVRVALLEAAGRPASDDRPPAPTHDLPPDAVALALGADTRLRVVMAPASGGGTFVVRLRGDVAPIMAARILALARRSYYDGLAWHRVEPDFVIQGGSPGASEYVGYRDYLRDELGTVTHARGTVGMSTRGHDTGDAQWFVNLRDNPRLDRDYTVFAEVVQGIDVVDGIMEGDVIERIEVVRP